MKTAGVLAGLGPLAGAYFYLRLCELTPAAGDEGHIPVVLASDTTVPSRLDHLQGIGPSPVPGLQAVGRRLIRAGADFVVMPSSTTSYYQNEIQAGLSVPMISMIEEVATTLAQEGYARVGLLGTTPTRTYGVYEEAFARHHLAIVYPDEASQNETMQIIWEVKGHGNFQPGRISTPKTSAPLLDILNRAWSGSTDVILLACTELPVVGRFLLAQRTERPVVSATDILAKATIRYAMAES
ncbi:MAG: hypothetical protein C7B45_06510 [Sulfobacillus acidophilus]|uniref:Aspartate racemase n=1 Tax=Sulfobacillus acidophilus TaxID=53633 RepID=A0A2T2WJP9_9FIRM|nr:MAG: hypothetical protein C7B45_06510 [Sulfobacillus acidophilus]